MDFNPSDSTNDSVPTSPLQHDDPPALLQSPTFCANANSPIVSNLLFLNTISIDVDIAPTLAFCLRSYDSSSLRSEVKNSLASIFGTGPSSESVTALSSANEHICLLCDLFMPPGYNIPPLERIRDLHIPHHPDPPLVDDTNHRDYNLQLLSYLTH